MTEAQVFIQKAEAATSFEDALEFSTQAVMNQLLDAMKASGVPKADQTVEALRRSRLDRLLTRALGKGRLPYALLTDELERMRRALADREVTANDLKLGILAFDEAAQRLAVVAGRGGRFQYPTTQNRARDSLITFARSLHR